MMRVLITMLMGLAVAGCVTNADDPPADAPISQPAVKAVQPSDIPAIPTRILSYSALERLRQNSGLTLQWIDWDKRGKLKVWEDRGEYGIEGWQGDYPGGAQYLYVNGRISEIGEDYFLFDGEISIYGTPDADRNCKGVKKGWHFAVTQNRKYWRLREFEWCDYLTDYVDIYF